MNNLLECTKGPWRVCRNDSNDPYSIRAHDDCVVRVNGLGVPKTGEGKANAALIAAAYDHALIGWALIHADLEWGWAREGVMDWHLGEKHYPLPPYLDPFGFPTLTDDLRALLIAAMEGTA